MEQFRLIEIWVTPGTKSKPESRVSRHTYFDNKDEAFDALTKAEGDVNRLVETTAHTQIWYQ